MGNVLSIVIILCLVALVGWLCFDLIRSIQKLKERKKFYKEQERIEETNGRKDES